MTEIWWAPAPVGTSSELKQHGLIQDNCFLSDDDYILALPLPANLDEEVQEDETDMFKKLIAEGV